MATRLKTRLIQKHGTYSDWESAVNFAPLRGELVVYEADANHPMPRFKIGIWDGVSEKTENMYINNLPFCNAVPDKECFYAEVTENTLILTPVTENYT